MGGRSADFFETRRLFRFDPAWFGPEIFRDGPIALIDEEMPVVALAPHDPVYQKVVSNIEEVRARLIELFTDPVTGDPAGLPADGTFDGEYEVVTIPIDRAVPATIRAAACTSPGRSACR